MFIECRKALTTCLEESGIKSRIHTSRKTLRQSSESRIAAVLFEDDQTEKDGSKRIYTDGQRKKRRKKYSRQITYTVVIGEYTIEKVQEIYDTFMQKLPDGIYVDGNYVDIDPKQADWIDDEDSILKAKCAVQLKIVCTGGIYADTEFATVRDAVVTAQKEEIYGGS